MIIMSRHLAEDSLMTGTGVFMMMLQAQVKSSAGCEATAQRFAVPQKENKITRLFHLLSGWRL